MSQLKNKKIMIIDDDEDFKVTLIQNLSQLNCEIEVSDDGLNAVYSLSKANKLPDVIIMDINMQQLDGIETSEILNENPKYKDIPIIYVSGAIDKYQAAAALHKNPKKLRFLKKPIKIAELLEIIKELVS